MTYSTIQFTYDSPRCNSHYLMSLKLKQYRKKNIHDEIEIYYSLYMSFY